MLSALFQDILPLVEYKVPGKRHIIVFDGWTPFLKKGSKRKYGKKS